MDAFVSDNDLENSAESNFVPQILSEVHWLLPNEDQLFKVNIPDIDLSALDFDVLRAAGSTVIESSDLPTDLPIDIFETFELPTNVGIISANVVPEAMAITAPDDLFDGRPDSYTHQIEVVTSSSLQSSDPRPIAPRGRASTTRAVKPEPRWKRTLKKPILVGNNKYGSGGKLRCQACRKRKAKCEYVSLDWPCKYCMSKGLYDCDKVRGPKRQSCINPSRPLTLFNPEDDYETLQEISRFRTASGTVTGGLYLYLNIYPLKNICFQYYGPYISSPGLRHALLTSMFTTDNRKEFHIQETKRYLQRKLDRPEDIDDGDLITAACLAFSASIDGAEVHIAGVSALFTCLQNQSSTTAPLSLFRSYIFDVVYGNYFPTHFKSELFFNVYRTRQDRTRARLDYIRMALQRPEFRNTIDFHVFVQFANQIRLQNRILSQRTKGQPLRKDHLQSALDDGLSWIEVIEQCEEANYTDGLFTGFLQGVHEMRAPQSELLIITSGSHNPDLGDVELRMAASYYHLLIMISTINVSATILEALVSSKTTRSVVCLHRDLSKIGQLLSCYQYPRSIFYNDGLVKGAQFALENVLGCAIEELSGFEPPDEVLPVLELVQDSLYIIGRIRRMGRERVFDLAEEYLEL